MSGRSFTEEAVYQQAVIYPDKNRVTEKVDYKIFSVWADPKKTLDTSGGILTHFLLTTLEPVRKKGEIVVGHEFINATAEPRQAWQYSPGQRRVRRAPTVGYDSPSGAGGFRVYDEDRLFNGAPDRYNWSIVGKKEIYIPYNNYKIDQPDVNIEQILSTTGHINPDIMRYEKHRVWIVQATLKPNARHLYAKRVLYLDEDSWLPVLADGWDAKGQLWKTFWFLPIVAPDVPAILGGPFGHYNLQSGDWIANNMMNEKAEQITVGKRQPESYFTPDAMAGEGVR